LNCFNQIFYPVMGDNNGRNPGIHVVELFLIHGIIFFVNFLLTVFSQDLAFKNPGIFKITRGYISGSGRMSQFS